MSDEHIKLGNRGEVEASRMLRENGVTILAHNYRWSRAEVDIIAQSSTALHFVEVKTRRYKCEESALRSVGYRKQQNIMAAASRYMEDRDYSGDFQFDIVIVLMDHGGNTEITWYKDAFGFFN